MRVLFERNVPCTMRDGVVLRANVYRPDAEGKWPVLLARLPYGKDILAFVVADYMRFAESGYVVVVQDTRGCFASEGEFHPFEDEVEDGYDSVEWAANLPYSNGDVGMFGISYYGFTQWAAAVSGHPALKTIFPVFAVTDAWEGVVRRSGALEWGLLAGWNVSIGLPELSRKARTLPDFPQRFGRLVYDADHLGEQGYFELPLNEFGPLRRADVFPYVFRELERGPGNTEYRDKTSIVPHYETLQVSAHLVGGWFDIFNHSTIESYEHLRAAGREVRLVLGPWSHLERGGITGDINFGLAANMGLVNLQDEVTAVHLRWFDAQLKDQREALEKAPLVQYFVMGENRWHTAEEWPLPETKYTPWYLHSQGHAQSARGDGTLSPMAPEGVAGASDSGEAGADEYVYHPARPVLTHGGNLLVAHGYAGGPKEQSPTETREDVLVYTSEVLTQPVEVTGRIKAKLWVESSAPDTDFVVRLTDVHPDGKAYNLADGILRMSARNGDDRHDLMEPGTVYAIEVDCWSTSNLFLPGHRIRVQITSSNFPRWNRNLNTGASNETTAEFQVAHQRILHDEAHPSHILLPVIPR